MLSLFAAGLGFIYQPKSGQIWDPSCFATPNGTYYCVSMYSFQGNSYYTSGFLSASDNGVHWRDVTPIAPSLPGKQWWKGFVMQLNGTPPLYVLNHGVWENRQNDALRILTSSDLLNWTVRNTSRPDPRWYHVQGRWDHMYMSEDGAGGYIGFPVSSPNNGSRYAGTWPGIQRSADGVHWSARAPLNVTWGGAEPQAIEEGGFERLELPGRDGRARYFLIGGGTPPRGTMAYSMWAFGSDRIDGPYAPVTRRFRLSGGGSAADSFEFGALAAWARGRDGERLISQYAEIGQPSTDGTAYGCFGHAPGAVTTFLKWQVHDGAGHGKGRRLDAAAAEARRRRGWLAETRLLEGERRAARGAPRRVGGCQLLGAGGQVRRELAARAQRRAASERCLPQRDAARERRRLGRSRPRRLWRAAGVTTGGRFDEVLRRGLLSTAGTARRYTAALLDVGTDGDAATASRIVHHNASGAASLLDRSGQFECGAALKCGVATVTALQPGVAHHVLLLLRNGMWELYADGLLVQTCVGEVFP